MPLENLLADVRYSMRVFARRPLVFLLAIISISVAVGGSTAIFTAIDAILLRPLPFEQPDRLTSIWTYNTQQDQARRFISYPDFTDWREASLIYEEMGAWYNQPMALTGAEEPLHVNAAFVSHSLFPVLQAQPLMGRFFEPLDNKDENSVVLSHGAWQEWFGADDRVLGRRIYLNGSSYTIIGVMPATFQFPIQAPTADVWLKMNVVNGGILTLRGERLLSVIGRMKPGITLAQARAEMAAINATLQERYPKTNANIGVEIGSLTEEMVGEVRPLLLILLGAVGLVLLIACVTVSNLLISEGLTRSREIAVRMALGAHRPRIIRQLLTQYMLISIAGGIAGGLIGFWACQTFVALSPVALPGIKEIDLNWRVMGFTAGITTLTCILSGLAPATQLSAPDPAEALRGRASGPLSPRGRLTQKVLIVTQVAVTQTLLVGAGLLIHSLWHLQRTSAGVDTRNVLSLRLGLPALYGERGFVDFFQRLQVRLRAIPGVNTASSVIFLPFSHQGNFNADFDIEGRPDVEGARPSADLQLVQPEYFRAMGIRLIEGRDFRQEDNLNTPNVVIINEKLARTYFEGESPIGKRIRQEPAMRAIIGVVSDVRHRGPQYEAKPEIYMPLAQFPMDVMYIVIKADRLHGGLTHSVRAAIKELDGNLPIYDIQTMDERLASTFERHRFSRSLLTVFAGVALFLTMVGLYGLLTNWVTLRKREIAVRMAVGAPASAIRRAIVGRGMTIAALGSIIGIALAVILTRFLESLLFGVTATDPLTFALLAGLFALLSLAACYMPARRASKADPMAVLQAE